MKEKSFDHRAMYNRGKSILQAVSWKPISDRIFKPPSSAKGTPLRLTCVNVASKDGLTLPEVTESALLASRIDHLVAIGGESTKQFLLSDRCTISRDQVARLCRRMPPFVDAKLKKLEAGGTDIDSNATGALRAQTAAYKRLRRFCWNGGMLRETIFEMLIGVFNAGGNSRQSENLKRLALIYDRIAVFGLRDLIDLHYSSHPHSSERYAAELEWLMNKGVLIDPETPDPTVLLDLKTNMTAGGKAITLDENARLIAAEAGESLLAYRRLIEGDERSENGAFQAYRRLAASQLRLSWLWLSLTKEDTVLLAHTIPDFTIPSLPNQKKTDVWQAVIEEVPVVTRNTPWESILEFRADEASVRKHAALRAWVNQTVASSKPIPDIREELDYLRNEYVYALKVHKLEFGNGFLEIVTRWALELTEDVIKLRLSQLPDTLFKWRKLSIDLQKAELKATGREVSYLLHASKAFSR